MTELTPWNDFREDMAPAFGLAFGMAGSAVVWSIALAVMWLCGWI